MTIKSEKYCIIPGEANRKTLLVPRRAVAPIKPASNSLASVQPLPGDFLLLLLVNNHPLNLVQCRIYCKVARRLRHERPYLLLFYVERACIIQNSKHVRFSLGVETKRRRGDLQSNSNSATCSKAK